MVGKSMLEVRFGPLARLARCLGWDNPAFFASPGLARLTIMVMDAWTFIPFMMIMLLAGLQSLRSRGPGGGSRRWRQPVAGLLEGHIPAHAAGRVTVIVIRVIFKLKLADIIINVTAGGPGGATDSVTSFIYREYRDRSNVGYGTLLAMVYLVLIIVFVTLLLELFNRLLRKSHGLDANERETLPPSRAGFWRVARRHLWRADRSGRSFASFPIYWTITTSFKTAPDVTQGQLIPFVDFSPDWRGWRSLGLSPDTIGEISTRPPGVPQALLEQRHRRAQRLGAGGHPRLARGLRAHPLQLQVRLDAQQGHLLLLPQPAHPAAGRARAAVPGALQGARAAGHARRHHHGLHPDGAADRHLDHARPVQRHPDRARGGGPGRWPLDLGRVPADRAADRPAGHGRRLHPSAWSFAGTSTSLPRS